MDPILNGVLRPKALQAAKRLGLDQPQIESFISDYRDMLMLYRCAIRDVSTRLEILDDEFQIRHRRNPIHSIQTRLKSPQSTIEKMGRRNLTPNIKLIQQELSDIAGIRVICSYVEDIYRLADLLCAQSDVELQEKEDYIKTPKPSGYRSMHMVISVPVHLSDGAQRVPVEIQIRTIAMDFWATLEHQLRYKAAGNITTDIVRQLRECADSTASLDAQMQQIYHDLELLHNHPANG